MNAPAKLSDIWVFLAQSPLLWLSLTLLAYLGALWLHARSGRNPMVNPVLVSVIVIVGAAFTMTVTALTLRWMIRITGKDAE